MGSEIVKEKDYQAIIDEFGIEKVEDLDIPASFFENNLPGEARLFNEFHALIVTLAKNYCRTKPACRDCPLKKNCQFAKKLKK